MNYQTITFQEEISLAGGPKRILFANAPADGHFNPLTSLAVHLAEKGHDVRWYSSSDYAEKLEKLKIHHYPFIKAKEITGASLERDFPERNQLKGKIARLNFDIINFFVNRSEEYYADILEIHKSFPFDLLIADVAFTGIPFIKEKMNIPVISIGIFPLTESSVDLPPSGLGITPSYSIAGKIKQAALRFITSRILFKKSNKVLHELLDRNGIPHNNEGIFDLVTRKSTLLLQSGTPGFEYRRSDLSNNIRFIGGLLPFSAVRNEQWFDNRLNRFERIVLVTQGTVERDVEKLLVPTLEAFRNSNTLVVATTGGSRTQELRNRYNDSNFIIEDFIPFSDVMPYADVYISNGGYGGVMLGIEYRLPMVVAGIHEGKNEINARIGYFGLGINLKKENPSAAEIRTAVEEIYRNHTYRQHVISLSEEFENYDPLSLVAKYVDEVTARNDSLVYSSQQ